MPVESPSKSTAAMGCCAAPSALALDDEKAAMAAWAAPGVVEVDNRIVVTP